MDLTTYHSIAMHILNSNTDLLHAHSIWMDIRLSNAIRGSVPVSDVLDKFSGMFSSRAYLKKKINAGQGTFWDIRKTRSGESRLWIYRPERVAAALGVEFKDVKIKGLDYASLFSSSSIIRAALFDAVLFCYVKGDSITISREKVEELTGVSMRVQRKYHRGRSGRRFNFSGERGINRYGDEYEPRQLPNTYFFSGINKSFARKDNPRTGAPKGLTGRFFVGGTKCRVNGKVYFTNIDKAKKEAYNRWVIGEDRPVYLWKEESKSGYGTYSRVIFDDNSRTVCFV